ncbi:MAG: insulinase family protein, partial [Armatimonadetes bacterium]|nr:insulinase family protein [Candidatus Hippobium faecium]
MAERFYPLFDKEELKKEIGVVLSEMEGYENRPTSVLSQSLSNTLFEGSPYRRPIIGYREDLENINRENLIDFYKKFYIPNNATLVLAGDIDRNKAIECINKYFAPVSKGKVPYRKYYSEPSQKSFKSLSVDFCGETEISYFGFHIPNIYHKDADALTMLGSILSDGKNSRLYKSLVSTGKAVQVYAAPLLRKLESFFVIDVTANSQYKSDDFSEEVIKALEDVKKMPVTEEEIKTCLNQLKADIIYETDSVSGLGNALGMADVYGNWKDYNEQIPRLEKVTPKDISRVLNKYFVPNNCTLVSTYHVKKQKYVNVPKGKPDKTGKINCLLPETTDVILNNLSDNKKWICPKKFILQNGITVIVSENKGSSTVAVEGFVRHGDMYEPINQPGVSDMTARMLSSGTETRNYLEIAKSLDSVGAYIDFDISCEKLSFSGKSLSEYTDLLLYNLADCLVHSVFPEDRISFSQDAFLADLYYNKEVPNKSASNIFYNNVVEKGKPYYLASADETIEYIKKITRKDIFDFYSELRPEDTVIAIAGDVDGDKISELCNKYFSDFESGKKKKYITESVYSIPDDMKVFDIPMEKKSEAAVLYGYPINMKRESEDFYKFKLCNQILGGGGALNSRFGIEIRENRGLVYGISSGFSGGKFNGIWRVGFGTNRKSVDEAL